jgi:hypothetical protein
MANAGSRSPSVSPLSDLGILPQMAEIYGDEITRAQVRVAAQVDCTPDEALLLMRNRARSSDVSVLDIAEAVLRGEIQFDAD